MHETEESTKRRFELIEPHLSERTRRLVATAEARVVGHGGISLVSRATGVSRRAIQVGLKELKKIESAGHSDNTGEGKVRRSGGGRHRLTRTDPRILELLESLIEPTTRGDPESPLRCGRVDSALVAGHGGAVVSAGQGHPDLCRRRRQQWLARASVENRITGSGRRTGHADPRLPLAARNEQMEQDRAQAILLHNDELAGTSTHQPRSDRQSHQGYPQPGRAFCGCQHR